MRTHGAFASLFVGIVMLLCPPAVTPAGGANSLERSFSLVRDGKVFIEIKTGAVEVNSWRKDEVRIIADKNAVMEVQHIRDNVTIDVKRPGSRCEIYVPEAAQVRVDAGSGRVKAGDIGGSVDIRTTSGDINVASAGDGLRCKTISGDIQAGLIVGGADLKTTSGDIRVDFVRGAVRAGTLSGNIEIAAFARTDDVEIESISGNIKLKGELAAGGIYEVSSHSGNIEFALPAGSNFELRADTFSGNIDSEFEVRLSSGKIDRRVLVGTAGKGGARLRLSSFSGNIRLKRK